MLRELTLSKLNPYDDSHIKVGSWFKFNHPDEKYQKEHEEGISFFRSELRKGVKLFPILVAKDEGYQIKAGFKRYMAHKAEGLKKINCIVYRQEDEGKMFIYKGWQVHCIAGGQNHITTYKDESDNK